MTSLFSVVYSIVNYFINSICRKIQLIDYDVENIGRMKNKTTKPTVLMYMSGVSVPFSVSPGLFPQAHHIRAAGLS